MHKGTRLLQSYSTLCDCSSFPCCTHALIPVEDLFGSFCCKFPLPRHTLLMILGLLYITLTDVLLFPSLAGCTCVTNCHSCPDSRGLKSLAWGTHHTDGSYHIQQGKIRSWILTYVLSAAQCHHRTHSIIFYGRRYRINNILWTQTYNNIIVSVPQDDSLHRRERKLVF